MTSRSDRWIHGTTWFLVGLTVVSVALAFRSGLPPRAINCRLIERTTLKYHDDAWWIQGACDGEAILKAGFE